MSKTIIDDGYSSYLVKGATFVGKYQIPVLAKHDTLLIQKDMIPFDERSVVNNYDLAIEFFIYDE